MPASSRRRRPSTSPLERVNNTMKSSPVQSWGGRLPVIPRTIGGGGLSTREANITTGENQHVGQLLAATGTVTIPSGGGNIVDQLTTEIARVGFSGALIGGTWAFPYSGTYWVHVVVRYTDGYRNGGTVVARVVPSGPYIGVDSIFPGSSRPWTRLPTPLLIAANASDLLEIDITPTDGASRTAEVTVRVGLVERIGASPRIDLEEPAMVSSSTEAKTTSTSVANLAYPTGPIQAGDLLIITASCRSATFNNPSGFTKIREAATGNFRSAMWVKTATGSESGGVGVQIGSEGSLRSVVWHMHLMRNAKLPVTDHNGAAGVTLPVTAPSITGTNTGLLVCVFGATYGTSGGGFSAPPAGMTILRSGAGSQNQKSLSCFQVLTADGATGTKSPTSANEPTWTAVAVTFPNINA